MTFTTPIDGGATFSQELPERPDAQGAILNRAAALDLLQPATATPQPRLQCIPSTMHTPVADTNESSLRHLGDLPEIAFEKIIDHIVNAPFEPTAFNMDAQGFTNELAFADTQIQQPFPQDKAQANAVKRKRSEMLNVATKLQNKKICTAILQRIQPTHLALMPANPTNTSGRRPEVMMDSMLAGRVPLQTLMLREARPELLRYLPRVSESLTALDLDQCLFSHRSDQFGTLSEPDQFAQLTQLTSLQTLSIARSQIHEPQANTIGQLTNLRSLRIAHSKMVASTFKSIGKLTGLVQLKLPQTLTFSGPLMRADFAALTKLTKLSAIDFSNRAPIFISALRSLTALVSLESLKLTGAGTFDQPITDPFAAQDVLAHLTSLKSLDLAGSNLHNRQIIAIAQGQSTPSLTHLNLSTNMFDNSVLPYLENISTLQSLDLSLNSRLDYSQLSPVISAIAPNGALPETIENWPAEYRHLEDVNGSDVFEVDQPFNIVNHLAAGGPEEVQDSW